MKTRNRYRKWARFDNRETRKIIECFSLDLTASKTSQILWIERKTINDWYEYIRQVIYIECEKQKQEKLWWGIFELDESYFWPTRIKGKKRTMSMRKNNSILNFKARRESIYRDNSWCKSKEFNPYNTRKNRSVKWNKYRWMESIWLTRRSVIWETL